MQPAKAAHGAFFARWKLVTPGPRARRARFPTCTHFNWNSRSRRTSKSKEVAAIIDQKTNKIEIPLFIKKSDAEGSDFYYMGNCILNNYKNTKMNDGDEIVPVVNIIFKMNTPVPKNLYNYLVA